MGNYYINKYITYNNNIIYKTFSKQQFKDISFISNHEDKYLDQDMLIIIILGKNSTIHCAQQFSIFKFEIKFTHKFQLMKQCFRYIRLQHYS